MLCSLGGRQAPSGGMRPLCFLPVLPAFPLGHDLRVIYQLPAPESLAFPVDYLLSRFLRDSTPWHGSDVTLENALSSLSGDVSDDIAQWVATALGLPDHDISSAP